MSDLSSIAFSFVTFDYIIACNTHSRYLEYEKKKRKKKTKKEKKLINHVIRRFVILCMRPHL